MVEAGSEDARQLFERAGGDLDRIDGPMITALALEGDPMALRALAELGEWLGRGLAQVAAVLDPDLVLIGGGLAEAAGDLSLDPVRRAYADALSIRATRPVAPLRHAGWGTRPASSAPRRSRAPRRPAAVGDCDCTIRR